MKKSFVDQLFAFIATPVGIVGIAVGLFMVLLAVRYRPLGWFMFSLWCFAASLNAFSDRWIKVPPPLVFPLQQLRAFGRPLSIVLLVMLIILALSNRPTWRQKVIPKAIYYLLIVQAAIVFKTLIYGDATFAIVSGLTFGGIIFMLQRGVGQWIEDDAGFYLAVRSIGISGVIFLAINIYQFVRDRYAVTFSHGRFLGTTGNPQHAAVLLAATIPCLMFLIQRHPRWNAAKVMWLITLLITSYFLVLTGSRTGVLMGIMSVLLFFRNNSGAWFRVILTLAVIGALGLLFLPPQDLTSSAVVDTSVSERFTDTDNNTRVGVSLGLWNTFTDNLLFGAPLEKGGRLGFGENSWLSAGATLGLVGFIPILMMGWESLKSIWKLYILAQRQPHYFYQSSVVMAGLGSMLIGSLFEAYLLGNMTFSIIAFLFYQIMAAYLLEVDRVRTDYYAQQYYMQTRSVESDRSGAYQ